LLVAIACLAVRPAWGQVSGGFFGTVSNEGEAAIPNATVTLRNAHTGLVREIRTDPSGNFAILAVPAAEDYASPPKPLPSRRLKKQA
jgi:hypothetical protein